MFFFLVFIGIYLALAMKLVQAGRCQEGGHVLGMSPANLPIMILCSESSRVRCVS